MGVYYEHIHQKTFKKVLTFEKRCDIIAKRGLTEVKNGGLAQLARASGSYPAGRWFKSDIRYHTSARWSSG